MSGCVLVSSAELFMSTWGGAEVRHAPGCDGKCERQRQLDAQARLRQQSVEAALRRIDEGEEDE